MWKKLLAWILVTVILTGYGIQIVEAFDQKENMYYACMGLVEETGEIIAELRKPLFKGNFHEKPLDTEEIKKELGDLMWYIALICKNANIDTDQLKDIEINEYDNRKL